MVIFIHGFGSSGLAGKATAFRAYFKEKNIPYIAPSLSFIPKLAISTLEELIDSYDDVHLIGSSLGGYYALYLSQKYDLKTVLINPSLHPDKTLNSYTKEPAMAYYDGSSFSWRPSHVQSLEAYKLSKDQIKSENYFLLLQKGDDVLDYQEALCMLPKVKTILEEGGSHSFDRIERHFDEIVDFFTS